MRGNIHCELSLKTFSNSQITNRKGMLCDWQARNVKQRSKYIKASLMMLDDCFFIRFRIGLFGGNTFRIKRSRLEPLFVRPFGHKTNNGNRVLHILVPIRDIESR
jgi:hypothetical protein